MKTRWLSSALLSAFSVVAIALLLAPSAYGQVDIAPDPGNSDAGVVISPEGVLRMQVVQDPTGQLTRQRVMQARALDPDIARQSDLRKISLNRLEAALAENLAGGAGLTDDMRYLAGLTRLEYVFFYPETGDIVIAGPAEGYIQDFTNRPVGIHTGRAVLELQDLVTALRAFPAGGDPTASIGCSIDPTQEGLANLQQFLGNVGGVVTPDQTRQLVQGMQRALGQQEITIRGIPDTTHFAQVIVEADYRMKLIGIGLEEPPVRITSFVDRARPGELARNGMARWFFVPNYECVRVSDDMLSMRLEGDGVKLVGEDELVQGDGNRVVGQGQSAASQAFVDSFTAQYGLLADREPVYAQLRNLVDISIAAAYIQEQDYYGRAGWQMSLLGDESMLQVENYRAPETVETAVNAIWKGRRLLTPIGGGVTMDPTEALSPGNILPDEDGGVDRTRQESSLSELADGQWWWD